jgi:hypothetical protein
MPRLGAAKPFDEALMRPGVTVGATGCEETGTFYFVSLGRRPGCRVRPVGQMSMPRFALQSKQGERLADALDGRCGIGSWSGSCLRRPFRGTLTRARSPKRWCRSAKASFRASVTVWM